MISGGFGDIPPITSTERLFYILVVVTGVAFYSYAIGTLTSIVTSVDKRKQGLIDKFMALHDFSKKFSLPIDLQLRIKRVFENNFENISFGEDIIFEDLPSSLKAETLFFVHKKIFEKVKFFNNKDAKFVLEILEIIKNLKLQGGDVVYSTGDAADEMYFIVEGKIQLVNEDGVIIRVYGEGGYFGDTEIFRNRKERKCNAIAHPSGNCELIRLKKDAFFAILEDHHLYKKDLLDLAEKRYQRNIQSEKLAKKANYKAKSYKNGQVEELMTPSPRRQVPVSGFTLKRQHTMAYKTPSTLLQNVAFQSNNMNSPRKKSTNKLYKITSDKNEEDLLSSIQTESLSQEDLNDSVFSSCLTTKKLEKKKRKKSKKQENIQEEEMENSRSMRKTSKKSSLKPEEAPTSNADDIFSKISFEERDDESLEIKTPSPTKMIKIITKK